MWSSTILKIFHLLDFMFWLVLLKIKWPNFIMIVYKNHILSLCRSQNLSSSAPCYQKFQDQNTNRCICFSCYNILSPNVKWENLLAIHSSLFFSLFSLPWGNLRKTALALLMSCMNQAQEWQDKTKCLLKITIYTSIVQNASWESPGYPLTIYSSKPSSSSEGNFLFILQSQVSLHLIAESVNFTYTKFVTTLWNQLHMVPPSLEPHIH